MVGHDEIQTGKAAIEQVSGGNNPKEVAAYVLTLLTEMVAMADTAGHTELASDIEKVLSDHSIEDY